jgi:hypothetical protein
LAIVSSISRSAKVERRFPASIPPEQQFFQRSEIQIIKVLKKLD